jgi:phage terminase small subunit
MPRTVRRDPNLKPGKPEKPVNLSARAAVAWDRLVSQLEDAQIQLTTAHSSLLSIASTLSADIADAWETVKEKGAYIHNAKTGAVQEHPASKKLDALRRDLIKVLTCLSVRAVPVEPKYEGPTLEEILRGDAEIPDR